MRFTNEIRKNVNLIPFNSFNVCKMAFNMTYCVKRNDLKRHLNLSDVHATSLLSRNEVKKWWAFKNSTWLYSERWTGLFTHCCAPGNGYLVTRTLRMPKNGGLARLPKGGHSTNLRNLPFVIILYVFHNNCLQKQNIYTATRINVKPNKQLWKLLTSVQHNKNVI